MGKYKKEQTKGFEESLSARSRAEANVNIIFFAVVAAALVLAIVATFLRF